MRTHDVVGVLVLIVEHPVGGYHVVDDVGLADLLGPELLRGRQIPSVVVSEVVVGDDRRRLDAGAHLQQQQQQQQQQSRRYKKNVSIITSNKKHQQRLNQR